MVVSAMLLSLWEGRVVLEHSERCQKGWWGGCVQIRVRDATEMKSCSPEFWEIELLCGCCSNNKILESMF